MSEKTLDKKWIPAACWHDCGGRCLLKAEVENGQVVRVKTDDLSADSPDCPQQRACQRGFAQRRQIFADDRLKYPMKRKHWSPENPNGHLRGRDEWERISWEEAFKLTADTIKKIYSEHGPQSALVLGGTEIPKVLNLLGGYTPRWGQVSWGAWPAVYEMMTGHGMFAFAWDSPDRFTLREQKLVILWGANPAVSSAGLSEYNYLQAHKAGCRFVVIDPRYNESIRPLDAQWIPIRPGTDTAMILGMMYHIIENDLHDQEYLDRYCVGFDRNHMPQASDREYVFRPMERPELKYKMTKDVIDPGDNLYDYLFAEGEFSSEEKKTPEWASGICGVPAETIRKLAEDYALTRPASIFSGGAPARVNEGESFPQALVTLGLVCGQIGRGGAGVCACMHERASNGGQKLCFSGPAGINVKIPDNPYSQKTHGINNGEMWDAVLTGEYTGAGGGKKSVDIKMLYQGKGGALNQRTGMMKGIEAYRKVDFALCVNYVMNTSAQYSDIVLPCTTEWERPGTVLSGNREILIYGRQVIKPLYEAKSDQEIARGLAAAMGFSEDELYDIDEWQQLFNKLQGCKYTKADGKPGTLLTITDEDIRRYSELAGHEITGQVQEGLISLKQFEEEGIFRIPEPDKYRYRPFEDFINDPENNPLKTATGKFEIFCRGLHEYIKNYGFGEKSPLPVYVPVTEGYEAGIAGGRKYQLVSYHGHKRAHHTFENVDWLSQEFPQRLWINPADAQENNIHDKDFVLIESAHGKTVCPAYVTERITPGIIAMAEGAWAGLDENGIDRNASANALTGQVPTGQGHTGYNSVNCTISCFDS